MPGPRVALIAGSGKRRAPWYLTGQAPRWSPEVLDLQNRQACLRLAGQHVPAIYGSSGDVNGHQADPTFSVDAAKRQG